MSEKIVMAQSCYWKFKDEHKWRYGYPTHRGSLVMMGLWNGDSTRGIIVDPKDIEVRKYR